MRIIDPGHHYALASLDFVDGDSSNYMRFVKRIGDKYPGNEPPGYSGTNIQEVCRVLIDRIKYLDNQFHCSENTVNMQLLRQIIRNLEFRAAREHGAKPPNNLILRGIEFIVPCQICGHIYPHSH